MMMMMMMSVLHTGQCLTMIRCSFNTTHLLDITLFCLLIYASGFQPMGLGPKVVHRTVDFVNFTLKCSAFPEQLFFITGALNIKMGKKK